MDNLTNKQVQLALSRIERGLTTYLWLQRQVRACDVSKNEEFQRRYSGFYRVRRDFKWRLGYFSLLESSKLKGIEFPEALGEINRHCRRIEASFASKLVATLDPSKPVIDKFVLEYFELRLPRWGVQGREVKTIDLYNKLCVKYRDLMQNPSGKLISELFDVRYPDAEVSDLKKIDLVLWQIRPR